MTARVAINGFGRIGRAVLRAAHEREADARKVILSAPAKGDEPVDANLVLGVNVAGRPPACSPTTVIGDTQVKVVAWYDREGGYANRLVELAGLVLASVPVGG
jgi:glyceraldehyde-3-phosphate dehydrogenase/erythrose-4-phosphate dehydrogenase